MPKKPIDLFDKNPNEITTGSIVRYKPMTINGEAYLGLVKKVLSRKNKGRYMILVSMEQETFLPKKKKGKNKIIISKKKKETTIECRGENLELLTQTKNCRTLAKAREYYEIIIFKLMEKNDEVRMGIKNSLDLLRK